MKVFSFLQVTVADASALKAENRVYFLHQLLTGFHAPKGLMKERNFLQHFRKLPISGRDPDRKGQWDWIINSEIVETGYPWENRKKLRLQCRL
jgi:hypothetical protein